MGLFIFSHGMGRLGLVSKRIREVPKNLAQLAQLYTAGHRGRRVLAFSFLSGALALGAWAKCLTEEEVLRNWRRMHYPTAQLWSSSLSALGLRPLHEGGRFHQVLRMLPISFESENKAWISKDSSWVATQGREDDPDPQIFCRVCERAPEAWLPLGSGWEAFETALTRVREAPKTAKEPAKRPIVFDPREIRY